MKNFIFIISVSLFTHYLNKYVLENEEVLLVYLSEKLNAKQIENFFNFQKNGNGSPVLLFL